MRLYLNRKFTLLWLEKNPFEEVLKLDGKEYRNKEGRRTFQADIEGNSYFVKIHRGIGWKEIFKNLLQLRLPVIGASNEYLAANKLASLGVDTLTPVAFGKKNINPAKQLSFIITEDLINTISLEDYCVSWNESPPPISHKKALIELLASVSKIMHGTGVNHRDYYICHFLLDKHSIQQALAPKCYLIDLHRSQLRSKVPLRWLVKDLSGLYFSAMDIGLTKRDLLRFIRVYSGNHLARELEENREFWSDVVLTAEKLYLKDHGRLPHGVSR